jgi:hypothetical protein
MIGRDPDVGREPRSIIDRTVPSTPRTAPTSWPFASIAAGTAKKWRNSS